MFASLRCQTDPCSGAFFGNASSSSQGTILNFNMATAKGGPAGVVPGGLASVLTGTGAGQWRRLTANLGNGTVHLDQPFLTPVDATSVIQLSDMRGRMIFDGNEYTDVGAFQLYGNAYDVVVANSMYTRTTGLFSWALASSDHDYCPNTHIELLSNEVNEGNHLFNYVADRIGSNGIGVEPFDVNIVSENYGGDLPYRGPLTRFVAMRGNIIHSNGGLLVSGASADVVVENTRVANSTCPAAIGGVPLRMDVRCVAVDDTRSSDVVLRGNKYIDG